MLTPITPTLIKYLYTSNKTIIILIKCTTPMTSYYSKYQSKIKSQKIIINTKKYSKYSDNINILIIDTKKVTRKYIKNKYLTTIEKLKVLGYNNKATKLAKVQLLIQEL